MAQSNALRVRSVARGPICYLQLFGTVDESFNPNLLLTEATGKKIILNLRAVSRLSSFGVREWTNAMRDLCKKVERVFLVECSPAVVTQLNMVANFAGTAQILSVQAPFYCELCGWETDITINIEQGKKVVLPECQCEQCTAGMTFDDDPLTYFNFPLQQGADAGTDQTVLSFVRSMGGGDDNQSADLSADKEPRTVVGIDAVPQAGRMSQPPRPAPREEAPTFMAKARPIMIGLAIPAVVAAVIAISWPTSDDLTEQDKVAYQEHLSSERYEQAKALVDKLVRDKQIGGERAKHLEDEIIAKALAGYGEDLVAGRFEEAATLVMRLSDDRVLPPNEGNRLHKEISKTALAKYRELAGAKKYEEAEALVRPLEQKGVLPSGLRTSFTSDLSRERERIGALCRKDVLRFVKEGKYQEVIEASKGAALFGPFDTEMTMAISEANRKLKAQ